MRNTTLGRSIALIALCIPLLTVQAKDDDAKMDKFIDKLMSRMTLAEKIGQLNLGAGGNPMVINSNLGLEESVARGFVSSCGGADLNLQRIAVEESRLGIPLLFGLDVIHGYCTTFPIPLATASSWNMELIERSAQIAAKEATSQGISWTWSPMVDIARDPRWGRVAEGAGEDPFLGSCIARAMVRGYQGERLDSDSTMLACFKHFALYGAAEGGRDYNTVDMSRWYMYNFYLPPYKAAVEAGCGTGMSSFNVIDGIPATGNSFLLNEVLREEWGFKGFMVSDANSVAEMEFHRVGDPEEATRLAITAGLDMDMGSRHYII
ncbi:MAG: glycoside hydrolase family 3 N-terminal domain-containing protein [Candidatus Cryptobacteroides sp.]